MSLLVQLTDIWITQAQTGAPEGGTWGSGFMSMTPILLMFVVIYFLLIRPASKQKKDHQLLLNALSKGDEIVTVGGMYGKIVSLDEKVVVLEIADRVKIKILRDRIAGRWPQAQQKENKTGETKKNGK